MGDFRIGEFSPMGPPGGGVQAPGRRGGSVAPNAPKDGGVPELCKQAQTHRLGLREHLAETLSFTHALARERENAMEAFKIMFSVFVLRLVLPLGLLLLVGEQLARRSRADHYGK